MVKDIYVLRCATHSISHAFRALQCSPFWRVVKPFVLASRAFFQNPRDRTAGFTAAASKPKKALHMKGHKCPWIATAVRAVVFALEEAWRMFLGVFDTADHDSDAVIGASRQEQGVLRVRVRASMVLYGGVGRRRKRRVLHVDMWGTPAMRGSGFGTGADNPLCDDTEDVNKAASD